MGPKKSKRRNPGCKPVKAIIPESIHALGPKVEMPFYEHYAVFHWPQIVGEAVARHVKALYIERQKLYLFSYLPVWSNNVMMMQYDIIDKINRYVGRELVKEIGFKNCVDMAAEERSAYSIGGGRPSMARKEIRDTSLSPDDMKLADGVGRGIADGCLASSLRRLGIKRLKMRNWRDKNNYHVCPGCGAWCQDADEYCPSCKREHLAEAKAKIRRLLRDMPWARYAEIKKYVDCTPYMVNVERACLVQRLAAKVSFDDADSIEAKTLVMLYRSLPPEQLNREAVRRSLYSLRYDLLRPTDFKPLKRYEALSNR